MNENIQPETKTKYFQARFGSNIYKRCLAKRTELLKVPFGQTYTQEELDKERNYGHIVSVSLKPSEDRSANLEFNLPEFSIISDEADFL